MVFFNLKSKSEAEGRRRPKSEAPFLFACRKTVRRLPRFSDLSWPRTTLYRELVEGSISDQLDRLGLSLEEVRS